MSYLKVLKTSLLASVQDLGRNGYADIGVSQSGAMDEFSFNWANKLLGNSYGTNALEINLGGVEFEIIGNTQIVFCGANADIELNSRKIPMWKSVRVKQNDKIKIGFTQNGSIIYLGIKNGFKTPKILGSNSISIKEGGKPIRVGEKIEFEDFICKESRKLKSKFIPKYEDKIILHVIPSYQYEDFDDKEMFFTQTYTTTPQSNRMGFRLDGYKLKNVKKGIISEGICYGAIQITSDGSPIVLLKERQTIGGYPKIGSILPLDCFLLSQSKIGTKIKFEKISIKQATKKMREFYKDFL